MTPRSRVVPRWPAAALTLAVLVGCSKTRDPASAPATPVTPPSVGSEGGTSLPSYSVKSPAAALRAGADGSLDLAIDTLAGWHFSLDYPTRVDDFKSGGRVTATLAGFRNEPGSPPEIAIVGTTLRVTVPVKAAAAGVDSVTARVRFAACSDETCVPVQTQARWAVSVE